MATQLLTEENNYSFGDFFMNTATRQLFAGREILELSSKGFDILLYLIKNRGKVVTKDEMFHEIWGDTFVEENNLPVHISALRRILGEKRGESRYIKTVSGKGYIFISPVEIKAESVKPNIHNILPDTFVNKSAPIAIAVMPFQISDNSQEIEYLANGITQSLIDDLSQIPNFKIISFSGVKDYRNSKLNLQEIGFQLGVGRILQGSLQKIDQKLDINVELIDVSDLSYLWGTQYQVELRDIFSVKSEISLAIAEKLKPLLKNSERENLSKIPTTNSKAFQLIQKGKHIIENFSSSADRQQSLKTAIKIFQDVIKEDSDFALAYYYLGKTYFFLGLNEYIPQPEASFQTKLFFKSALAFNPNLSEGYELKAMSKMFHDFDFQAAKIALTKSLELNPNNAYSLHMLSLLQSVLQEFAKSIETQIEAIQLSPTSISYNVALANRFYFAGDFEKAIVQAEETLELDSNSSPAYYILALAQTELKLFDEALINIEKAHSHHPNSTEYLLTKISILWASGNESAAEKMLAEFLGSEPLESINNSFFPQCLCVMGKFDETIKCIETKMFPQNDIYTFLIPSDPRFKPLHNDSRFISIIKKLQAIVEK